MILRAVVFDVYRTLLAEEPPAGEAAISWVRLWEGFFGCAPRLDLAAFVAATQKVVAGEHASARARGVPWPEVYWPAVVSEVLPELRSLPRNLREDFDYALARLMRRTTLMTGVGPALRLLLASGVTLGIASNAQPYTLRELQSALGAVGLDSGVFSPDVVFWSFRHGFSKPDPHVFQLLTARFRARGMAPEEILMVGDRQDNDIDPARASGWATYHLAPGSPARGDRPGGDWLGLVAWLDGRLPR